MPMSNAVFTVAAIRFAVADFTWCEIVNVPRKWTSRVDVTNLECLVYFR